MFFFNVFLIFFWNFPQFRLKGEGGSDPNVEFSTFFFLTGSLIVKKYILWNEVAPQHLTWLMYGSRNKCTFTLSCNSSLNIKCNNRCPVVSTFTCSLHLPAVRSTSIHEIKKKNINVVNIIWKHSQTANTRNKVQIIPTNSNSWYYSCVDSIIFITYAPCSLISLYWIPQYEIYEQVWEDMTIQDFENKTSSFRL